jgi:hypothetical protein
MRTVHFNKRAVALTLLIGAGVILLTIVHITSSTNFTRLESVVVPRDVIERRKLEEKVKALPVEVDHHDPDVAAEKHEDFIDEPRKHPETDDHKSGKLEESNINKRFSDANNAGERHEQSKGEDQEQRVVVEPPKPKPVDVENGEYFNGAINPTFIMFSGQKRVHNQHD